MILKESNRAQFTAYMPCMNWFKEETWVTGQKIKTHHYDKNKAKKIGIDSKKPAKPANQHIPNKPM